MGPKLTLNWRYFSLEQANNEQGPQWKIWEQHEDYPSRGLHAFWAAEAARRQGEAAFDRFHFALLEARHEQRRDIADMNILTEVAGSVGLDMTQLQKDCANRHLLAKLAKDHTFAVEHLGLVAKASHLPEDVIAATARGLPPRLHRAPSSGRPKAIHPRDKEAQHANA
jgi:hypothetical protein